MGVLPTPEQGFGVHSPAMGALGHSLLGLCVVFGVLLRPRDTARRSLSTPGWGRVPWGGGVQAGKKPNGTGTPACSEPLPPPRAPPGGPILLQCPSGLPCPGTHPSPAKFPIPFYWCPPPKKKLGIRLWTDGHHGWKGQSPGMEEGAQKKNPQGWGQTPGVVGTAGGGTGSTPGMERAEPSTKHTPGTEGGGWGKL